MSYWFDGADSIESLTTEEATEFAELIAEAMRWAELPHSNAGDARNLDLRCFRLRNDPFPSKHRPLFMYMMTAFFLPLFGSHVLSGLGFRPYRSGSTEYWFRPPGGLWAKTLRSGRPWNFGGEGHQPLVFCHGIGVGPTMCISFLQLLARGLGEDHPIFLVDTAAVSMRFSDDVPGAREIATNMVSMLQVWGFNGAHFVGHSFGSFLVAWMLRYQRSYVWRCTFMDPVCFLLLKVLVDAHKIQQLRWDLGMDTMEIAIKYFVLTELFVCNFVCRCFFWEESQLSMCDLEGTEALLVLESDDKLVPSHSVRLLACQEQHRRAQEIGCTASKQLQVLWVEGQPHAGFLVDVEANREVNRRLREFHDAGTFHP